jgi:DNA-binding LacI/PurR family transcriptional regulator
MKSLAVKITINNVADKAGVSIGTASAFMMNRKNSIEPETRTAVLNTMKKMIYRPRGNVQNNKKKRKNYTDEKFFT